MAWLAVNKYGQEAIYSNSPEKVSYLDQWTNFYYRIFLPKGTIKKLIGRELTWEDEPVELK